jgi:hypothetical protein
MHLVSNIVTLQVLHTNFNMTFTSLHHPQIFFTLRPDLPPPPFQVPKPGKMEKLNGNKKKSGRVLMKVIS